MVRIVDYEDSDEDEQQQMQMQRSASVRTPSACITEEVDKSELPNSNVRSEESSSKPSWSPIRSYFIDMGYSLSIVDKAIEECGSTNANAIFEFIMNNQECQLDSKWCLIKSHFESMGFSSSMVDQAMQECGIEDQARILDFLSNYKGSSSEPSSSSIRRHFMLMGFSSTAVDKAIEERGTEDEAAIFESILTYELLKNSSSCDDLLSQSNSSVGEITDDDGDEDSGQFYEVGTDADGSEEIDIRGSLLEMGYTPKEVSSAIERHGVDSPLDILIDSIDAVRHSQAANDGDFEDLHDSAEVKDKGIKERLEHVKPTKFHKRKQLEADYYEGINDNIVQSPPFHIHRNPFKKLKVKEKASSKGVPVENEDTILPLPHHVRGLVGFGVPGHPPGQHSRELKEFVQGPPYFYFENVYSTPKGVWETISRFLYDVEPEFVDSKYFSVSSRRRGYIHNLPIENRFQILPLPPMTIQEAFPETQKYWPSWDYRTKLNCINTVPASVPLCERLRFMVKHSHRKPSFKEQALVLEQCKKWNLLWVGPDQLAPLEPHETELALGYDVGHTRGYSTRTERSRSLGNAFQVNTVGYHLSVLKAIYPKGINVLSLFSGIGGAEVALYRLGIPLKCVVSAEIKKENRLILRSWWEKTGQKGKLIEVEDVQDLTDETLEQLINSVGGFDLIIGGSPCNNLTGNNRTTRDGLEGKHSSLFYEFSRIVNHVRNVMRLNGSSQNNVL